MGAPRVFAIVAACVLSAVAGQPDYDRADTLAAVAAARGTTPVAAAAERRLSADSCEDSQTWRHTRTCAWVGEKPAKRCKANSKAKVFARDAYAHARATATTLNAHWMDGASWRGPYATKGSLVAREFIEDLEGGCPGAHPDFPNKAQSPTADVGPFWEDIIAGTATLF
jgi:ribonuclease HI